ncbi:MAG: serine/threonine protein kinase [Oceanospirillaceae bacterium]|nr:serine/threonine protein kinase [Oceanospirillaceae bacterium]
MQTDRALNKEYGLATEGDIIRRPSAKRLIVTLGGYSSAGPKDENQDAFAACLTTQEHYKGVALCVADGVSCSEHAQQASTTSVTHFLQDYYSTPDSWDVKTAAGRVLSSLNAWLYHHGQQASARHNSLVTTFSGLILKSNTAHLLHVGDSRIYRLRAGILELLTRDHNHQQGGRQYLSRALGMDTHLEVDYQTQSLRQGDVFVLTSDGVHGFLTAQQLQQTLNGALQAATASHGINQHQLEQCSKQLVQQALAQGGDDNATCCLLVVEQLPQTNLEEAHRTLCERAIPPVMKTGDKIDHFQIQEILYAGTRSHVYRVRNLRDQKDYVLKAPSLNFQDDLVYLEGFVREQWVGSRVDPPNIMKISPPLDSSRFLYHICEKLDGDSLRQWLHDHPAPSAADVRKLVGQLIHALRAFQRLGMVHRDLKPENVLVDRDGGIKLIDFGTVQVRGLAEINSAVKEECPQGSVNYIAPETVLGTTGLHNASHQSDLFSLGVMVYELFSGAQPFSMDQVHRRGAKSFSQWRYTSLLQHRPDLPLWLDLCIQKACEPNPAERYQAYSEFWTDLHQPNASLQRQYRQKPLLERNPLRFWQILSGLLLLVIIVQALIFSG